MKLRLFTLVYGDQFVDWFERGLVKSLLWPKNRIALTGAKWDIYVSVADRWRVISIAESLGLPIVIKEPPAGENAGEILMAAMADHARRCVEEDAAFLALQPDHIFGEGSIAAMIAVASENKRICVAMAHPRVSAGYFLADMPSAPMSNAELVTRAMDRLHPSFALSNHALEKVNTWFGGVAWREIGTSLWGVTAHSPTVFLARLNYGDVEYLSKAKAGAWDHEWPETLMADQRQRLIGSSDAAFTVELTEANTHIPRVRQKPPGAPTTYRHDRGHNRVNRNTVTVWRGLQTV